MGFLHNITKLFRQEPLTVGMTLTSFGVALSLYDGEHTLDYNELSSDKIQIRLPPPLVTLFKNQPPANNHTYVIALPHAQTLLTNLKRYLPDKIQLDCADIENLQQTAWPTDFRIHWHYDARSQRLEPQFSGADQHLGCGWFHRQQKIWALTNNSAEPIIGWLNRTNITGPDIFQFVSTILPAGQRANLPLSCDLSIETNFQFKLQISKMLKKSLEVELTANMPAVLAKLQYLDGEPRHMISGTKLLPDLRTKLGPQLYALAHQPGPQKVEGDALLSFLQYEVKPNGADLDVDLAALDAAYPIVDAATLGLVWKLNREASGGIGRYRAIPWLEVGSLSIQFQSIVDEIGHGTRFARVNDYWLEFTEAYKKRHRTWLNQQVASFQLFTGEVLRAHSERLKATGLKVPLIEHPATVDELQTTKDFLTTMAYHGLPVVLAGLQKEMPNILAGLCQKLLQQSTNTRILWVAAKSSLPIIQAAMKTAGVPTVSGFPVGTGKSVAGGVYLVLPFVAPPRNLTWDLFLVQELDALLLNEEQTRLYSVVQRLWSITTFEKTQRVDQDRPFRQAMQILQSTDVPLDIFRRRCLLVGSDQEETWLTRLASPFKQLFRTDEPPQRSGMPIPPRPEPPVMPLNTQTLSSAPSRFDPPPTPHPLQTQHTVPSQPSPLPPTINVFRPTFTNEVTISVATDSFVDQAKLFVDRIEAQAIPVPFLEYWPTYAAMSDAQLRWYFFWRTQARQGNFLPTDLSYLFLHVYEGLNLVGFTTPQVAFDYLVKLWEHYRILQPKLDRYLTDWLADFLVVYGLPQSPLTWYANVVALGNQLADQDLAVQAWLHIGGNFLSLNNAILYELANYSPLKNKFYQVHNQENRIELAYKQGLQAINEYTQQTAKLSFFDQHRPKAARTIARAAFAGARYEGSNMLIKITDVYAWSAAESLAITLQAVMKYTENLLREQVGFKQRLRGIEISSAWAAVLDKTFTVPETRPTLKIDLSKVETLKIESDAIRQRLLVNDEPATHGESITALMTPSDSSLPSTQPFANGYTKRPADTPAHLLTDLAGMAAVMEDATMISARLLRALREQNWLAQPASLATILDHQFLNVVIDEINGRAITQLGDALLFEENGSWVVADDYQDEIAYILDHPDYNSTQTTVPDSSLPQTTVPDNSATAVTNLAVNAPPLDNLSLDNPSADIPEIDLGLEWNDFAQQMQPFHWEGLAVLLQAKNVMPQLDVVARSHYITANQLIDEINTVALNSIGDLVIDASDEPPILEMENRENLRLLMQWAIDHTLVISLF